MMQLKTKTTRTSTVPSPFHSCDLTTKIEQNNEKDHDLIVPEYSISPKLKSQ